MKVIVNGIERVVPSSLSEITLKERADFQIKVGNDLDAMLKAVNEVKDEIDQEIEFTHYSVERMFRSMAFFLDCSVESLKEFEDINSIANIYSASMEQIFRQEHEMADKAEQEFVWNDEKWYIDVPELKNGHKMTFGEFIDSKQTVQDMMNLGKNKWECLIPLCTIFLRKQGEPYQESFLYEGSDRLRLMETLPLDIGLQVGFFLKNSLNTYIELFQSFTPQESSTLAGSQKNISKLTVG